MFAESVKSLFEHDILEKDQLIENEAIVDYELLELKIIFY